MIFQALGVRKQLTGYDINVLRRAMVVRPSRERLVSDLLFNADNHTLINWTEACLLPAIEPNTEFDLR